MGMMLTNFMMSPVYSGLMDSQMTNINQYIRGWARVNGEGVSEKIRSIPDKRKMDYGYRDIMSMFLSMYGVELSYRLIDERYFAKNLTRILNLHDMSKRYDPGRTNKLAHNNTFKIDLHNTNHFATDHYPNYHIPHDKELANYVKTHSKSLNFKALPHQLHELMLGSLVDTSSYDCIPTNLENLARQMKADGKSEQKVNHVKLLAHHFRRVFLPEEYFREHLSLHCNADEKAFIRKTLDQMSHFNRQVRWATEKTRVDEARRQLQMLAGQPKATILSGVVQNHGTNAAQFLSSVSGKGLPDSRLAIRSLHAVYQTNQDFLHSLPKDLLNLSKPEFKLVYDGVHWSHFGTLWNIVTEKGLGPGLKHFKQLRAYSQSPILAHIKEHPNALFHVHHMLQKLKLDPVVGQKPTIQELAKYSPTQLRGALREQSFGELIQNSFKMGWQKAFKLYERSKDFSESGLMELMRSEMVLPKTTHKLVHLKPEQAQKIDKVKVYAMLDDLTHKVVTSKRMRGLFEGGKFWLKLPLSIVFYFMTTGVISNILDNKYIQPYQREVVNAGVNPRTFMRPLFLSLFPAVGTFVGLMRTPWVKKLGYVGSFALSGGVATLGYIGLTFGWFKHIVKGERAKIRSGVQTPFVPEADKPRGAKAQAASQTKPVVAAPPVAARQPVQTPAAVNPFQQGWPQAPVVNQFMSPQMMPWVQMGQAFAPKMPGPSNSTFIL